MTTSKYPKWYRSLFVFDMLDRFGFYGMAAILVLYAAGPESRGGLDLPIGAASALFGAWIALCFTLALPGGWLGDRVLGARRAMFIGGVITVAGFGFLTVGEGWGTGLGLVLLAAGTGLYKPNFQVTLNVMYGADVHRRESGIALMYTGVQVSALLAPLLTGYLGEQVNWHLGFAAAGSTWLILTILLRVTSAQFNECAQPGRRLAPAERVRIGNRVLVSLAVLAAILGGALAAGALRLMLVIGLVGVGSMVVTFLGYAKVYRNPELRAVDRRRLRGFLAVFLGATLFWMIIAHAGSLLNLFARDHVDRDVFGWVMPASWLLAATPVAILVLAPVFAWLMPRFGRRHNVAVKFSLGLTLVGGSFLLMALAAALAAGGTRVSPLWLIVVYVAHACGELVIAATSVAAAADVLPRQYMGRMMGLLWLFSALGGGLGAGVVQLAEVLPEGVYYLALGSFVSLCGIAFALWRKRLTRALAKDDGTVDSGSSPSPRQLATIPG